MATLAHLVARLLIEQPVPSDERAQRVTVPRPRRSDASFVQVAITRVEQGEEFDVSCEGCGEVCRLHPFEPWVEQLFLFLAQHSHVSGPKRQPE